MNDRYVYELHWTLASASPRRRDLLRQVGIDPQIRPAQIEEIEQGTRPAEIALDNARRKLEAVQDEVREGLLLAADTVVVLDGRVLGKPADADDARRMLIELSGREHRVITAYALSYQDVGRTVMHAETTRVEFRPLTNTLIDRYIRTGEPFDKAGAYGIQGAAAAFVTRVQGCYFTVVGLPLSRVLADAGTLVSVHPHSLSQHEGARNG